MPLLLPPLQKWLSPTALKPTPNKPTALKPTALKPTALPEAWSEDTSFTRPMLPPLKTRESFGSGSRVSATETLSVKRRKVSAKSRDAKDSVDVGPVGESRQEHLRRHDGGRKDCARCRFDVFGPGWMRSYGSARDPRTSNQILFIWLQERPARFQGRWALGFAFCAHAAVSTCSRQGDSSGIAQAIRKMSSS